VVLNDEDVNLLTEEIDQFGGGCEADSGINNG
jgi:hypothetical protein